jgi:uncharacterized HAD superfamily protein
MNIAVDIDGTLTAYPEFYKKILSNWNGKRYFLTGRPEMERQKTLVLFAKLKIVPGLHYDELIMYPTNYEFVEEHKMLPSELATLHRDIAEWKAKVGFDKKVDVMFDDNESNVWHMRNAGIYVLQVDNKYE